MICPISFDAAMKRIFGVCVDKTDIIEEATALIDVVKENPNYGKDNVSGHALNDRIAFLNTILMAMQEKL